MFFTDLLNQINASGETVQFSADNEFYIGIHFKSFFQRHGIHIPGFGFGIDEYRDTPLVNDGIKRRIESHIGAEYALALQCAMADSRFAVQFFPGGFYTKMKCRSAGRKGNGIFHSGFLGGNPFHFIDICAHSRHPVGLIRLGHIFKFFTVHRRSCEPDFLVKGFEFTIIHFLHPFRFLKMYI